MEASINLETAQTAKSWRVIGILFVIYFVALYFISLTTFRDLLLPVRDQSDYVYASNSFHFGKFLVYNYSLKVVYHLFQIAMVVLVLKGGAYLMNLSVRGKTILWAALLAHLIFFVPDLLKIIWFSLIHTSYTLEEFHAFPVFSLANLLDLQSASETILFGAFSRLTLFEVGFCLLLGWLLQDKAFIDYDKALQLVFSSYGTVFSFWLLLLTLFSAFSS
jgi:hypothetical protein